MIYISKFRSNDLNPSKGKQIEFNKGVVDKFFNFTESEHFVDFECHSILNTNLKEDIHVEFKLSPSRGDYKIYQNNDGSKDLKDFFLETLHLENDKNLDDYFAIKKEAPTKYILYYVPKDLVFSNFFSIASGDQILFTPEESEETKQVISESHQTIYYGAPGTGKSHTIKKILGEYEGCPEDKIVPKENIFRTTFHPDSDYSTFVGAYKPTMKKQYRYEGKVKASYYEDDDLAGAKKGDPIIEKAIEYSFIPQAFLNAYIRAYQTKENVYLIIEEINRGNCAQIFGDLFQLLDRDAKGVSEYPIKADADLKVFLEEELGEDNPGIKDGELCLPSNLYIYATMNTSDQSLFPIDSAFKRRWDWEYEPIKYKNTDWKIVIADTEYSWTSFQRKVNDKILNATSSEDKMLGDYFVNPSDGVITDRILLNKILFYLWNDVCKDGEGDIFKISETEEVSFSELYGNGGKQKLISMMDYLSISKFDNNEDDIDDGDDTEIEVGNMGKDTTRYAINGVGKYAKKNLAAELIKLYITQNPTLSASEVVGNWKSLGKFVSHFVETQEEYNTRTDKEPRVRVLMCGNENIYVSTNGWGGQGIMDSLISAIPENWNLQVEKL